MPTDGSEAAAIARHHSITAVSDPGSGLNAALEAARTALVAARRDEGALLVLPIDLSFATAAAINEARGHRGDAIACDQ